MTRREVIAVIGRGLVAAAVAAVMWRLGHERPALVLVSVATAITVACLVSPAFASAVERAIGWVQRVAGRGLALVLLGGVQLLVFTPVWLVLRVLRHDPLALGSSPGDESYWRPVPRSSRDLYRRPFAYERLPRLARGGDRLPLPRLRAVVGLVALVALLDVGLGAAVDVLSDAEDSAQAGGGLAGQNVPAARGEPWRVQLGAEINQVWAQKRYDPYLGWTMPDIEGKHVHVSDGVRRSWAPTPAGGDPVTVYFLGGSAMFGLYQRDEHTIPSEVARLAAADGIELRAVNYGRLAYVNWQEVLLLEQLVTRGSAPDLAVFYDGFNEILGQFQLGPHDEVTHLEAAEVDRRLGLGQRGGKRPEDEQSLPGAARRAWADVSLVHRLGRAAGVLDEPGDDSQPAAPGGPLWPDQTERPGRRGKLAATIHGRGVDLGRRLARSYGFETAFFWQPFLYGKRMDPGEEQLRGWLATDPDAWGGADAAARARLHPAVADLSGALDGVRAPVMYDFVHTNELGAKVMARAIYERLRPTLRRLAAERSP